MSLQVRSLASLSGLRIRCCPELWCRSQTRRRPAAIALIRPLAWEPPYAVAQVSAVAQVCSLVQELLHGMGVAQKKKKICGVPIVAHQKRI